MNLIKEKTLHDNAMQESEGYKPRDNFRFSETFELVMNASTSAATKLHQPSVTYLNKGQLYELRMKNLTEPASNRVVKCQLKIGFQVILKAKLFAESICSAHLKNALMFA